MKVILAYSGGLDTSVIIRWLKEKFRAQVIAYTTNIGQPDNPSKLKEKALGTGASAFFCEDLRDKFVTEYILPSLQADALYQEKYPLATSLSRPLIASGLVALARKEKADTVAHGCTGKGNDQVRFELAFRYLAPELKILAPVREWEFRTREEEMEYAQRYHIPVSTTKKKPYSIDWNLWGISIECGVLEDPWNEPPEDVFQITVSPKKAPAKGEVITIHFEKGIPVKLNGRTLSPREIIEKLTEVGGRHGVGRIDLVEDRLVGIKSREIYEAPAAVILHTAHKELERLVMSREMFDFKLSLAPWYSRIIYYGQWFSHLRECLDGFIRESQRYVSGEVRLRLIKGNCLVVGRRSPFSLYEEKLATYSQGDIFDHTAAKGFIQIFGLPAVLEGERWRKDQK
ncbi:MAG: argininosuccinate synthase [Candidatus Omnitrophica bacterium]|nr:argininosuccinate synthase [Candidatus Omnitrophota bacterium]